MTSIQGTVRLFDNTPLEGITVELYNGAGAIQLSDTTDVVGAFALTPVPTVPGDYWIRYTDPTGIYLDKWYRNHATFEAALNDVNAKVHVTADTVVLDVIINPQVGNPQPQGPYGEVEYGSAWRLSKERYPTAYEEFHYVSSIQAMAIDYGRMEVSWTAPEGTWDEVAVVRNFTGAPITPDEGIILGRWVKGQEVRRFQDAGLVPGAFVYYSVFVHTLDPGRERWVRAGKTEALVTNFHGWTRRLWEMLPWHYHVRDDELASKVTVTNDVFVLNVNATSGTMDFSITTPKGSSTVTIPHDATVHEITEAIQSMPAVGEGNVVVAIDEQKTAMMEGIYYTIELVGDHAGCSGTTAIDVTHTPTDVFLLEEDDDEIFLEDGTTPFTLE